MEVGEVPKM
jgi:hypothetical protein